MPVLKFSQQVKAVTQCQNHFIDVISFADKFIKSLDRLWVLSLDFIRQDLPVKEYIIR